MLWCLLRFPHKWFVFISSCLYGGSCLIYVSCVCMDIVLLNTYCFCFVCLRFVSRVPNVASLYCLSIFGKKTYTCSLKEISILSTSLACPVFISIYTSTLWFPSLIQLQSAILTSWILCIRPSLWHCKIYRFNACLYRNTLCCCGVNQINVVV